MNVHRFKSALICQARTNFGFAKVCPKNNNLPFRTPPMRSPIQQARQRTIAIVAAVGVVAASAWIASTCPAAEAYLQTNLVSDLAGMAAHTDSNLVNPWGIASSTNSPFWVADNHTGVSTLYDASGTPSSLVVTIPPAPGGTTGSPDGIVFNPTTDFAGAHFIFATEDGTISAWNAGTNAVLKVDNSASGVVFKGLAIGNNGTGNFLYAADFHGSAVKVFNGTFGSAALAGDFTDPTIPAGYAPFNIQHINANPDLTGGVLYVTYALQDADRHDDVPGPGHGYISKFDLNGNFLGRFASRGTLNSPWGTALAPAAFGPFGGALLVGNFGDGRINAFDPATGNFLGQLADGAGHPITIPGLWGLRFGNGGNGGDPNTLYFAAGIPGPGGMLEDHGLFGSISVVPAERQFANISTRASIGMGDSVAIGGFIVHSDPEVLPPATKRVLLRGLGPSLNVNGTPVAGRLIDPFLELHDANGNIIAVNDNWRDTQETEIQATGLAPTDDHESAIVARLASDNSYTAILRGVNNGVGIGLVEVYDLEETGDTHLANISGRAFVSTGDNVLIAGVIIHGAAAEQVLFRALGPSLAAKNVSPALADPVMDLFDANGNLIAHNDDWMNAPNKSAIIASGLAPTDPRESAILETPAAGNYTAIVRGKNNTTGIALAEAYRLGPPPAR
jgi:uncharacterized protein (TIGR03118 family)